MNVTIVFYDFILYLKDIGEVHNMAKLDPEVGGK